MKKRNDSVRRVVVTIEMDTDASLTDLKSKRQWQAIAANHIGGFDVTTVLQVQANVIKSEGKKK